ncbi:MAG TPA: Asp-tRNA(Asn)/Glu-tRNA(Gln) amidotransferase subunit GatC [Patescibacteria group bacterium]
MNVKNLAKLANLQLTSHQEENLNQSITAVIAYMDEIKNLDIDNITETTRTTEEENVLREDIVEPSLSQADALKNAKKTKNGFFVVPAIFEE